MYVCELLADLPRGIICYAWLNVDLEYHRFVKIVIVLFLSLAIMSLMVEVKWWSVTRFRPGVCSICSRLLAWRSVAQRGAAWRIPDGEVGICYQGIF